MSRADMEEQGQRTNKLSRVRSEIIFKNKNSSSDLCSQAGQDDLTPLTWLHSNVNIFPSVDTSSPSSSSSSSCTPVILNNNEDLQEKVLKVEMNPSPLSPDTAENTRKSPPLDQKQTAAASEEDGCLDLSENFKTEESKQLFLRNAIKI